MTRKMLICLSATLLCPGGCGEPTITYPQALEAIFLPLDGARGLGPDTVPSIFFSDEVDGNSVGGDSVLLRATGWSCTTQEEKEVCACETGWAPVTGAAQAEGTVVKFLPASPLPAKSCLAMICTTAVRGKQTAPLRSLGLPAESRAALGLSSAIEVGALQQFWTAE